MSSRQMKASDLDKLLSPEEQLAKINEVRKIIGPIADKLPVLCSDESVSRYLKARSWNTKKAAKMLKDSLKWRLEYKPEKIRWEDISHEAETGKAYKANFLDRKGRTVLVLRPGFQNTNSVGGQIRHLVYCMENAIMASNPDHEQMVWLIDFQGWTMGSISVKAARETANVLQNHYPERLAVGVLYNPPKIFESFWTLVKPFLEPKTYKKVRFAYSSDPQSKKIMEELFDMDKLGTAFGGKNTAGFNFEAYAKQMREDDKKMSDFISSGCPSPLLSSVASESQNSYPGSDDEQSSSGDEKPSTMEEGVHEKLQDLNLGCGSQEVPRKLQTN